MVQAVVLMPLSGMAESARHGTATRREGACHELSDP